jgi:hypothetical protein
MNILYITRGDHVDYQNDCLLIGLKELFGPNVIDINKQHHNYTTFPAEYTQYLYGKGFSLSRVLPDYNIDRTDILSKIRNKYFDYIIYGSIWRSPGSRSDLPQLEFNNYLLQALEYYPKSRIVAIDGNDETPLHPIHELGIAYFKRELIYDNPKIFPIGFAIPNCKVNFNKNKTRDHSFITPQDITTYIYNKENDYYYDYYQSRFGVTIKKGGWDCLRHYEIMANGCIPNFLDINECPEKTLALFPKKLCSDVLLDLKTETEENVYNKYIDKFEEHFLAHNTTKSLGKYVIDTLNKINN